MNSEIVYLNMFDTGPPLTDEQLTGLLANPEDFSKYEFTKPSPEEVAAFDVPSIFNLKDEILTVDEQTKYKFRVQAAVYPFGAFSIKVRYTITEGAYDMLSRMTFDNRINEFLRGVVARARKKVEASLSKVMKIDVNPITESYRFYYIEGDKNQILKKYPKLIASLMIDEKDSNTLEDDYVKYLMEKSSISYDTGNIMFVGWESCVMIDKEYSHEYELLMAEVTNLQLLEMRIYHSVLAEKLSTSSKTLGEVNKLGFFARMNNKKVRKLNDELGHAYDNTRAILNNVNDTAFGLGEWYLARVYSLFSSVFKLETWKASLEKDLDAIDNERKYVSDILAADRADFIEYVVVILIVIELLVEIVALFRPRF